MSGKDLDDGYYHLPGRVQTENEKRWLSWSVLNAAGVKSSYKGTVDPAEKARRRAKNRVAKSSRKANR